MFNHSGGGGTHADIYLQPSFRVKVRNVVPTVVVSEPKLDLKRRNVSQDIPVDGQWTVLEVAGHFKDGNESLDRAVTVQRNVPMASTDMWGITAGDNSFRITTR
jgi:hypothetical protein